ncbi:Fatty acid amide hydrolase [Thelohanellus kitauei]|uniref:Fatty acid amide hydrolase n=1 Tax=Thelohanellus kitauei TaxID=669202 RepID=A0A0C2MMY1_THEKT|nr:Fatty acid amide hydrolase [Thelohanellus kitauei]
MNVAELIETGIAAIVELISILNKDLTHHMNNGQKFEYNDINVKLMDTLGSSVTDSDLKIIKKQRTRSMRIMENIFREVDVFLLLTTSRFPEKIHPNHKNRGFCNTWVFNHHSHYSALSCFSGIPSLAINIGHDKTTNLPIGLQLMSRWWSEDLLLSVAYQIEKLFPLTGTPPDHKHVIQITQNS